MGQKMLKQCKTVLNQKVLKASVYLTFQDFASLKLYTQMGGAGEGT